MAIQLRTHAEDASGQIVSGAALRLGGALIAFGLLTGLALLPLAHQWDEAVTMWLQRATPLFDLPASVLVRLGNAEVVIPAVALTVAPLFLVNKQGAVSATWLVAGLAVGSILVLALQHVVPHPTPSPMLHRPTLPSGLFERSFLPSGLEPPFRPLGVEATAPYGFPSGHTQRTMMIACTALGRIPWLARALVVAMMAALVYSGDHWLCEVLGGLCLGWALLEAGDMIRKA